MKKRILSVIAISSLLSSIPCFSQNHLRPAYVVHHGGDTIRGFVHDARWDKNPERILFRAEPAVADTEFRPGSIRLFSAGDEYYESAVVDVDVSATRISELTESAQPEWVRDTVFLQILFDGETKKLLYLKDERAREHFFIEDDGYEPLIYKKYLRFVDRQGVSTKMLDENSEYKRQLFFYLNNCPEIQATIEKARYESGSLTRLFSSYHACISKPVRYINQRKVFDFESGVMAGLTHTTIQFRGPNAYYFVVNPTYSKSAAPSVGFYLDARLIRSRGLSITNDLFYTSFDVRGNGSDSFDNKIRNRFNYAYVKMHNLVKLDIIRGGLLHISAGVASAFAVKKTEYIYITSISGDESEREFFSRDFEFGPAAGLGFRSGRLTVDLRYEISSGISNLAALDARTQRIHAFAKFRLSK